MKSSSPRERVCAAKIDNGPTGTGRGSVGRRGASSQVATLTMYRARTTAGGHEAAGDRWKSQGTTPLSTIVILSFPLRCRVSVIYCFSTMLQIRSITTNYIQWFLSLNALQFFVGFEVEIPSSVGIMHSTVDDGRGRYALSQSPRIVTSVHQETEQLRVPVCSKALAVRVVLRAGVRFPQLFEGSQHAK